MAISADKKRVYTTTDSSGKKIGISLWELMSVLNYYKRDTNGKRNLGMIIANADINPLARCKPFRWKDANFESEEKRDEIRGKKAESLNDDAPNNGFGPTPAIVVANNDITHGVYEYRRPRGVTDEHAEWFRIEDFDGYWKDAVTPFHVQFNDLYKDSNSGVTILFHNYGINGWNEDECLRVDELLDGYSVDEPFALLIVGGGKSWLLPSTVTPRDVAEGRINQITIIYGTDAAALQGSSSLVQGAYLLNLDDVDLGTEFAMAIVTSHSAAPDINPTNGVREPLPANGEFGSLEFVENCDRIYTNLTWIQSLKGLTFDWKETSWGNLTNRANPDANRFKGAYELMNVDTLITLFTPAVWHRNSVTARVSITMVGAEVYTQSHEYVGGSVNFDYDIMTSELMSGVRIPTPNGTFSENLFKESNIYNYLFCVPKQMASSQVQMNITVQLIAKWDNKVVEDMPVMTKFLTMTLP